MSGSGDTKTHVLGWPRTRGVYFRVGSSNLVFGR